MLARSTAAGLPLHHVGPAGKAGPDGLLEGFRRENGTEETAFHQTRRGRLEVEPHFSEALSLNLSLARW